MKVTTKTMRFLTVLMMLSALFIGGMTVYAAGGKILATAKTNTKKAKITWNKVADADRYLVYYAKCGNKLTKKKKVSSSKATYTFKKLKKNTCYKVKVVAQKKQGGKYKKVGSSYVIHFVTTNSKYITNPKKINIKKESLSVKEGSTKVLQTAVTKAKKGKSLLEEGHAGKVRYFSTDKKVATVNSLGMVTGKGEGTCKIYAVAVNGLYDSIDITVKAAAKEEPAKEEPAKEEPAKEAEYTLTYLFTGTVPKGVKAPKAAKLKAGAKVTAATVEVPEGYEFSGWQDVPKTMPAEDVILVGVFSMKETEPAEEEEVEYTLTYKYTGDVPADAPAVPAAAKYAAGSAVKAADVPSVEGYSFTGWVGEVDKMPGHDVTVTGVWKAEKYTLSYVLYGDIPDGVKAPKSVKLKFGDAVTPEEMEVPEGYEFTGWGEDVPKTMPAEDVRLAGTFSRKTYTLTIKYAGPSSKSVPAAYKKAVTEEFKFGEKVKLPTPAEDGYKFCGWDQTLKTMPAEDVTVTGTWKKVYTLTYMLYGLREEENFRYGYMSGSSTPLFSEYAPIHHLDFLETKTQKVVEDEVQDLYTVADFDFEETSGGTSGFQGWFINPYTNRDVSSLYRKKLLTLEQEQLIAEMQCIGVEVEYPEKIFIDEEYTNSLYDAGNEILKTKSKEELDATLSELKSISEEYDAKIDALYKSLAPSETEQDTLTKITLSEDATVYGFVDIPLFVEPETPR